MKSLPLLSNLLLLAAALTACGLPAPAPTTEPPPENVAGQLSADKLSGTVTDPLLLGGSVKLLSSAGVPKGVEAIAGTIDASGAVELPLAAAPGQESFYFIPPGNCTFSGSASNPLGRINLYAELLAYTPQGQPLATISEKLTAGASAADALVARVYADSPQDVRGSVQCAGGYQFVYDIKLSPGWNAVELISSKNFASYKNLSAQASSVLTVIRR
ncbi:hypothetical protein [Deinococcus sp.]|uniref:hypothetical protein n=1 Tax=Deinococcus sp. TaxID=47478 RepID=UPI003B5A9B3F